MSSEDDRSTKPDVIAILERINELGAKLEVSISAVAVSLESLRAEMADQFSKLNKKLDILNRELLEVKAEQELHGDRIGSLERKPS